MEALELIGLGAALAREGLVRGSGGNLSYRDADRLIITARGSRLDALQATDLVAVSMSGQPLAAEGGMDGITPAPSSEWAMHIAACRARPAARVIVHAHPLRSIAVGLVGRQLPVLTPDQYLHLGAQVPVVAYLTPTTATLAEAVGQALRLAPAALLQNHGVIVTGVTIRQALLRLQLLEEACAIFLNVLATGAIPHALSERDQAELDTATTGRYRLEREAPGEPGSRGVEEPGSQQK